jgi:hypothetical protein
MVVPGAYVLQCHYAFLSVRERFHREGPLHRANEPFDPAVLPRAARLAVLQANARTRQRQTKRPRGARGLVLPREAMPEEAR